MTTFSQLDSALKSNGWCYDVGDEVFSGGKARLDHRSVLKLVPGMTLDELASYKDRNTKTSTGHRTE